MDEAKPNPLLKGFPLAIFLFGWQVHGLLIAIPISLIYLILNIVSNFQVISSSTSLNDLVTRIQRRELFSFIVFMIAISLSGAEIINN